MADIDMSAWFDDVCTTMSDNDKADEKLFIASQGNFAHRYPIKKDLFYRMSDLSIEGAALWMHGIDPRAIGDELDGAGHEQASIELPDTFSDTLDIIRSAVRAGSITRAPFPSITVNEINDDTRILKDSFLAWHSKQETATLAKSHAAHTEKAEAGTNTTPANTDHDDISSKVYWRIILSQHIKTFDTQSPKKKATVREVIKSLRGLNDNRIPQKGGIDELIWIDDIGSERRVTKKTVSTAMSAARKQP